MIKATLSFWNKSMDYTFSVHKEFNSVQHYDNYCAKMKSLGYTEDETWTQNQELIDYLYEGFLKARKNSKVGVTTLKNRLFQ